MIVVKVGGSLFDHPDFAAGLRAWLSALRPPVLVVPGGGAFADALRALDALHQLGEEASHWLALRAVTLSAHLLKELLPGAVVVQQPGQPFALGVLDGFAFAERDEGFSGSLPHSWAVTSDSLAARAAAVFRADRLILLKSVAIPANISWTDAAERGWVDRHFPTAVADFDGRVECLDFRSWLNERVGAAANG